jgi:hypothetical protein
MQRRWLDAVAMIRYLTRWLAPQGESFIASLPYYELCNARPLLVPGKLAQATRTCSCRVWGNSRSKADAFSCSVNPEAHSAIRRVYFLYPTRLAKIPGLGHSAQAGSLFVTPLAGFDSKFKFAIWWLLGPWGRDVAGMVSPSRPFISFAHPGCIVYQTSHQGHALSAEPQ